MRSSPRSRSSMTIPRRSFPTFANPIDGAIGAIPTTRDEGLAVTVRSHAGSAFGSRQSVANTFRTSEWDNPNWRAILAGVTPALKAARTVLI
jgi:hypothetical protein